MSGKRADSGPVPTLSLTGSCAGPTFRTARHRHRGNLVVIANCPTCGTHYKHAPPAVTRPGALRPVRHDAVFSARLRPYRIVGERRLRRSIGASGASHLPIGLDHPALATTIARERWTHRDADPLPLMSRDRRRLALSRQSCLRTPTTISSGPARATRSVRRPRRGCAPDAASPRRSGSGDVRVCGWRQARSPARVRVGRWAARRSSGIAAGRRSERWPGGGGADGRRRSNSGSCLGRRSEEADGCPRCGEPWAAGPLVTAPSFGGRALRRCRRCGTRVADGDPDAAHSCSPARLAGFLSSPTRFFRTASSVARRARSGLVPPELPDRDVAAAAENEVRAALATRWRFVTSSTAQPYLDRIARQVAARIAGAPASPRVVLVETPEHRTLALPSGTLLVSTGLLAFLEDEAELAFVLGHEIAHAASGEAAVRLVRLGFQATARERSATDGLCWSDAAVDLARLGLRSQARARRGRAALSRDARSRIRAAVGVPLSAARSTPRSTRGDDAVAETEVAHPTPVRPHPAHRARALGARVGGDVDVPRVNREVFRRALAPADLAASLVRTDLDAPQPLPWGMTALLEKKPGVPERADHPSRVARGRRGPRRAWRPGWPAERARVVGILAAMLRAALRTFAAQRRPRGPVPAVRPALHRQRPRRHRPPVRRPGRPRDRRADRGGSRLRPRRLDPREPRSRPRVDRSASRLASSPRSTRRATRRRFDGFVHRFTRGRDIALLLHLVRQAKRARGIARVVLPRGRRGSATLPRWGRALDAFGARLFALDARPFSRDGVVPHRDGARWLLPLPAARLGVQAVVPVPALDGEAGRRRRLRRLDAGLPVAPGAAARHAPPAGRPRAGLDAHGRAPAGRWRSRPPRACALSIRPIPIRFDFALSRLGILGLLDAPGGRLTARSVSRALDEPMTGARLGAHMSIAGGMPEAIAARARRRRDRAPGVRQVVEPVGGAAVRAGRGRTPTAQRPARPGSIATRWPTRRTSSTSPRPTRRSGRSRSIALRVELRSMRRARDPVAGRAPGAHVGLGRRRRVSRASPRRSTARCRTAGATPPASCSRTPQARGARSAPASRSSARCLRRVAADRPAWGSASTPVTRSRRVRVPLRVGVRRDDDRPRSRGGASTALRGFHLNDSKGDLGCRRDRHEHIGKGKVGLEAFRLILGGRALPRPPDGHRDGKRGRPRRGPGQPRRLALGRRAMKVADFDFELPPDRIAQEPAATRDASRLMVLDRGTGAVAHRRFAELPDELAPGDLLVLNDTKVLPGAAARDEADGRPRRGPARRAGGRRRTARRLARAAHRLEVHPARRARSRSRGA